MNKKQIEIFNLVKKTLEQNEFSYSHNDGYYHVWYRDDLRAELEEGEVLTFFKNEKEIFTLSNNFDPEAYLLFGFPSLNSLNENSIKKFLLNI